MWLSLQEGLSVRCKMIFWYCLVLFSCTVTVMQLDIFTRSVLTKEDYHRTFCTWNNVIVLVGCVADTLASTQQVEVRVMLFI